MASSLIREIALFWDTPPPLRSIGISYLAENLKIFYGAQFPVILSED